MEIRKVRAGARYRYQPVPLDAWQPPYGVSAGILGPGDIVKVVNLNGCPRANTMGHAHIEKDGAFAGLVHCNSLVPLKG